MDRLVEMKIKRTFLGILDSVGPLPSAHLPFLSFAACSIGPSSSPMGDRREEGHSRRYDIAVGDDA